MLEESLAGRQMRPGSLLTGRVVEVGPDVVMVSAGLKSDSAIPAGQFRDESGALTVAVGDEVEVALDAVEDGFGETRLSREKAKRAQAWRRLENAYESSDNVSGVISGKVKGGFTVDIDDIRAFLPGSLVDVRPVRDTSYLEGKPLEFKVIKLDPRRNNVVVSRRAVVEIENSAEREALLERLDEGVVMNGVVKNLTDYGAFVDLGGIDGPAAHHRHGLAPGPPSDRGRQRRRRDRDQGPQVRPGAQPRIARAETARRGSLGEHRPALSGRQPHRGEGDQHRGLRGVRRDRGRRRRSRARFGNGLDEPQHPSLAGGPDR